MVDIERRPLSPALDGWLSGLVGVIIFSGSLPATRVAVGDFSPVFLTSARAVIAALIGTTLLWALRQKRPAVSDLGSLAIVALGVVVGFPLLTALALQNITSARSIVFVGMLPLATAIFGVLRGGEKPRLTFWAFSITGAAVLAGFTFAHGSSSSAAGDLMMVAAILLCGLGYAEGAVLSRRLGGWQVISWALVLSFPVMSAVALITAPAHWGEIHLPAWIGLAYVSVFSMLIGFVFWYRGLALGGIANVGQLQLLQPLVGLMLAGMILHEPVDPGMIVVTIGVILCVAGAKRFGVTPNSNGGAGVAAR